MSVLKIVGKEERNSIVKACLIDVGRKDVIIKGWEKLGDVKC